MHEEQRVQYHLLSMKSQYNYQTQWDEIWKYVLPAIMNQWTAQLEWNT